MAVTPKPERKPMGIEVDADIRAAADRIAEATGLKASQVLRMAMSEGMPAVERRLLAERE